MHSDWIVERGTPWVKSEMTSLSGQRVRRRRVWRSSREDWGIEMVKGRMDGSVDIVVDVS